MRKDGVQYKKRPSKEGLFLYDSALQRIDIADGNGNEKRLFDPGFAI